jgi:1-acyl-sn-glycerol-3-phosphate acyltransferase
LLARGIYRSVEIDNPEPGWSHGPAIVVANHPTGFSDPALLLGLLEESPRYLAKATLWKTPGLGWFLGRIGAIPVYRAQDGSTAKNAEMFTAAFDALQEGATIALFPEGQANDAPSLGPIKTGAARLALGARAAGVTGLRLVPVGIHYEEKAGIRSRAYIDVGDVMDLDAELAEIGIATEADAEDHEAVHRLTADIERRLRGSAPDYGSEDEARRLAFASEVALREPGRFRVSYADRQRIAGELAHASSGTRSAVGVAADGYETRLADAQISDGDLMLTRGDTGMSSRLFWLTVVLVLLAPLVLAGVVLNLVPAVALFAAANYRHREMTPATVRLFSAIVLFLITWLAWSGVAWARWDWRMGLIVFIACPLYGAVAVGVLDRAADLIEMWAGRRRARRLGSAVDGLLAERQRVVATVQGALRP